MLEFVDMERALDAVRRTGMAAEGPLETSRDAEPGAIPGPEGIQRALEAVERMRARRAARPAGEFESCCSCGGLGVAHDDR